MTVEYITVPGLTADILLDSLQQNPASCELFAHVSAQVYNIPGLTDEAAAVLNGQLATMHAAHHIGPVCPMLS